MQQVYQHHQQQQQKTIQTVETNNSQVPPALAKTKLVSQKLEFIAPTVICIYSNCNDTD